MFNKLKGASFEVHVACAHRQGRPSGGVLEGAARVRLLHSDLSRGSGERAEGGLGGSSDLYLSIILIYYYIMFFFF